MDIDENAQGKIQEVQMLEQNMQSMLMQKQAFEMELNETENAISEISKSSEDAYKLISNIMIKTDKEKVKKDLLQKKDLINLRLKSIESQEKALSKQLEELRSEIMKNIK